MTYHGKLIFNRKYDKVCRICGTAFESTQPHACYCSYRCRMDGRQIISRWRKKKEKLDIIRRYQS